MSNEPVARIIFDEPVNNDAFDGKGHERSAKALADGIIQLADKGKDGAIGLEGSWGSGKSTVVSLTSRILRDRDGTREYHVFVFDMWVHQTNEFRHAFLDAFLAWLESKGQVLLNKKEIKNARRKVLGKTHIVETDNRKQYSFPAILFLAALPFAPLALNWTTPAAFDPKYAATLWGIPVQPTILHAYLAIAAAILLFSLPQALWAWLRPTIQWGYASVVGRWRPEARRNAPKAGDYPSFREALSWAASVFRHEVKKDIVTQSIRDEDPTNSEFHKVFRDMLYRAQQKNRRVVFVLDNIDRLGIDDVRKAWSEIRAVFVNGNHEASSDGGGRPGVIAIVPYDRAHVLGHANVPVQPKGDDSERKDADTEEDFSPFGGGDILSKTFSRIVKVAPPVPSDWHAYLNEQIETAFGDQFDKQDRYKIYKLMDIHLQIRREMITPRRIIAYLNELGAFWTQWKDTIPAPTIALYVLLRGQIENRPDVLKNAENPKWARYLRALNEPRWRQHFVALAYNVLPSRANQILLGQDIARELVADTPEALVTLEGQDGFAEIFSNQLVESIDEHVADAVEFSKMATNIAALKALPEGERTETWRLLGTSLERLPAGRLSPNAIKGLFTVLSRQHHEDEFTRAGDMMRGYLAKSAAPVDDKLTLQARLQLGADWVKSTRLLVEEIKCRAGDGKATGYWAESVIPADPAVCIGAAAECEQGGGLPFSKLTKSKTGSQPLVERLYDVIVQMPSILPDAIPQLQFALAPSSAASLITKIGERLSESQQEDNIVADLMATVTLLFGRYRENTQVRTALQKLQANGTLLWYLHHAVEQHEEIAAGQLLWFTVSLIKGGEFPPTPDHPVLGAMAPLIAWYKQILANQPLPAGVLSAVADCIGRYNDDAAWIPLAIADTSDAGLFRQVFTSLIDKDEFKTFDVRMLVSHYNRIGQILGSELLAKCLSRVGQIASDIDTMFGGDKIDPVPDELLRDVANLKNPGAMSQLLKIADERLRALSEDEWKSELKNNGRMVRLLLTRLDGPGQILLNANLYNPAVRDTALDCIAGIFTPPLEPERWDQLLQAIRPPSLDKTATEVLNGIKAINPNAAGAESFVLCYRRIARRLHLANHPDAALGLVSVLLNSRRSEVVDFLEQSAKDIATAYANADESAKGGLDAVLSSEEESSDQDVADRASHFRAIFGLPKRPQPETSETEAT